MRKLSLTMCLLLAAIFVYGQKKEVNNAYNYYVNGYLDRAKEAIDRAILNDETAKEAKTWMYRGNIYLRLADARDKQDKDYKNLCTNCAEIAYDSYKKAFDLDPEITVGMNIPTPQKGYEYCASFLYNDAVKLFGEQKYEEAYTLLIKANAAHPKQEYIVYLLAYTAEITKKTDEAKSHYNFLVHKKSKNDRAYQQLAGIYKSENDTVKMLKTMQDGEAIFMTKDTMYKNFVLAYSFFLSWAGKADEATDVIEKALEKYPNDHIFLISYGTSLSDDGQYEKAEEYLKRALEINPNETTAVFNLGTCYYNNYRKIVRSLGDISDQKEYDRQKALADDLLGKARVEMEKAHAMDAKDKNTLIALKEIYTRMGKLDELKAINEKLEALK